MGMASTRGLQRRLAGAPGTLTSRKGPLQCIEHVSCQSAINTNISIKWIELASNFSDKLHIVPWSRGEWGGLGLVGHGELGYVLLVVRRRWMSGKYDVVTIGCWV